MKRFHARRRRLVNSLLLLAAALAVGGCQRSEEDARANVPGLASALAAGKVDSWPVQLASRPRLEKQCSSGECNSWQRLELALDRAAAWMATFPAEALRFDSAVILADIRRIVDNPDLERAFEAARQRAERDADHPQQRFWRPDFKAPTEVTSQWALPQDGTRAPINQILHEALYCDQNGFRPEVMRYICGPMRDQGGYQSTHAIWALEVAQGRGCLTEDALKPCLTSIQDELAAAQPAAFAPQKTLDIDLFGERVLHLTRSGSGDPRLAFWIDTLVGLQNPDGSWGLSTTDDPPYYRFHATGISAWALAEWARRAGTAAP